MYRTKVRQSKDKTRDQIYLKFLFTEDVIQAGGGDNL